MKRILINDIEHNEIVRGIGTVLLYTDFKLYKENGKVIMVISSAKPIKMSMMTKPFLRFSINRQLESIKSKLFIDEISFKINQCLFTYDALANLSVKC